MDCGLHVIPVSVVQITTSLLSPCTHNSCSELALFIYLFTPHPACAAYISQHAPTRPDPPFPSPPVVSAGSFRAIRPEGALLEGVWVQAQLQWPRRHQMGAVHRPLRHLRNSLLKFRPLPWPPHCPVPSSELTTLLPSILSRFFFSPPSSYFVSLLPSILIASLIHPSHNPHPFLTRCRRLNLHHKKEKSKYGIMHRYMQNVNHCIVYIL